MNPTTTKRTAETARTGAIENIGPIEHLTFPIPEDGGVVVFQGRNGRGKSKALDAIDATINTKRKTTGLTVRDQQLRGQVEAFGAKLTIARSTRRSGQAEVVTLDGRFSIADLVDPGFVDPAAADARRLKALVQLAQINPDPAMFYDLLGGEHRMQTLVSPEAFTKADLVEMAAKIKRDLEARALTREQEADNMDAKAAAARQAVADIDTEAEHDEQFLQQTLENALRFETELKTLKRAADQASQARPAAQAAFDQALNEYTGPTAAEALAAEQQASEAVEQAKEATQRLAAQLREAEQQFEFRRREYSQAISTRKAAESHERTVAELRDQLDQATPTPPADHELTAAAADVDAARKAVETGVLVRRATAQREAARQAAELAQRLADQAADLRSTAKGTDDVLSEAMNRMLRSPLRFEAGRIVLQTDRGQTYYADLSEGERCRIALDIAIEAVGAGGELTIPQVFWEGLDPINRRAVAEHLRAAHVVGYTAEATADEALKAEVFTG